jgi:predicted nicotinamide N-methyase
VRPTPTEFIRANTAVETPPLVPEIRLHLATEITPIWQATEETLAQGQVPPPFWAFAWAGGQALARYILDHPETVAGKNVLDLASGSGMVAIAAAKAGARHVTASDIDPVAAVAITLNTALNDVTVSIETRDLLDRGPAGWAVVTAGDVLYEAPMSLRMLAMLRRTAARGRLALLGDPGRAYLPREGLVECARYAVPVSRELEDRDVRDGVVYRVLAD